MSLKDWTRKKIHDLIVICDQATKEPWRYDDHADLILGANDQDIVMDPRHGCGKGVQNSNFVVAARQHMQSLLHALDSAMGEIKFYQKREDHFAKALSVADGGQYRNDWDGAIQNILDERNALRVVVDLMARGDLKVSVGDPLPWRTRGEDFETLGDALRELKRTKEAEILGRPRRG
jgi:hypothetical protein